MDAFWASLIALSRTTVAADLAPVSLALSRPEPPCSAQFFALFRAPIAFSAPKDSIVFDRETAERPLPTSNRILARANEQVIAEYLARFQATDLSGQVRTRLIELLPIGNCNESQLADALNLSRRTLQRRLAEEGTSYSVLLDEARQELAIRYIGEQRLSIKETSYLLGFSEPGNFSRAFKRWTGQAPSNFRDHATG
jgi:AraC-like DNA-binding protein